MLILLIGAIARSCAHGITCNDVFTPWQPCIVQVWDKPKPPFFYWLSDLPESVLAPLDIRAIFCRKLAPTHDMARCENKDQSDANGVIWVHSLPVRSVIHSHCLFYKEGLLQANSNGLATQGHFDHAWGMFVQLKVR
jgi:hypothetical protein